MPKRFLGWTAALVVAGALVLVIGIRGRSPATTHRPTAAAPSPGAGAAAGESGARARQARAAHTLVPHRSDGAPPAATPGAAAFREYTDDYVQLHLAEVQAHMAKEGITLAETKELTCFALAVLESQDWDVVEDLTGHPIEDEARRQAAVEMRRRSQQMRDEVLASESEEARWAAIERVESGYLSEYYRITGMTPALLDQLLLQSINNNKIWETASAAAPNAAPQAPTGALNCVKRDPKNPDAPPVPVACP